VVYRLYNKCNVSLCKKRDDDTVKYTDIRDRLCRETRGQVNEVIWAYLEEKGYVAEVEQGFPDAFRQLVREYKKLQKLTQETRKTSREVKSEGQVSADNRHVVLSHILAAEAGRNPEVKKFREEVLGGRLLKPEEMEGWIEETRRKDGPPTLYAKMRLEEVDFQEDRGRMKIVPVLAGDSPGSAVVGLSFETLEYPSFSGVIKSVPINAFGILGRLKKVVSRIAKDESLWGEHNAVTFILTGLVPIIPKMKYGYRFSSRGGPFWVTMTFDVRLSPAEVARHYSEIRRKVFAGQDKPLSEKHEELALFTASKKDNHTWEKLMHLWNEKYPQWAYTNRRNFARDAAAAIRRIVGRGKIDFGALFKAKTIGKSKGRN
jgi:hypothetical protein